MTASLPSLFGLLVVVETEDDAFLGTLELCGDGHVAVCTGMAGRRPVLHLDDIEAITDAAKHPDVVPA